MNAFKQCRRASGLKQEDAAKRLGVDRTAVSKWESGDAIPRGKMLPKIAALYGCTVDELLSGDKQDCEPTGNTG